MNHLPFEEWLLSADPLPPDQARALEDHLQSCDECLALAQAWQAVRADLEEAPEVKPAPGFTQRWQANVIKKKAEEQRHRVWLAGGAGLVVLVGVSLLGLLILGHLSPAEILIRVIYVLSQLVVKASQIGVLIGTTFNGAAVVIPIAAWIMVATSLSLMGLLWAFTMWKIVVPKGVKAI